MFCVANQLELVMGFIIKIQKSDLRGDRVYADCECSPCLSKRNTVKVTSRVLIRILQPLMHYLNKKWSIDRYLQLWLAGWLSQYSVWLRTGRPGDCGSIPGRGERIFPLNSVSRPALGSTQRPVQWVLWVQSLGLKRGRGVTLTTHPHLMPRLRMSRSYTSSPPRRLRGV
jgi:hypothetical protein